MDCFNTIFIKISQSEIKKSIFAFFNFLELSIVSVIFICMFCFVHVYKPPIFNTSSTKKKMKFENQSKIIKLAVF